MSIVAAYAVPHPPLIIPSVGRGQEAGIQATIDAYEEVAARVARHAPDTVVITTPHAPMYRDGFFVSDAASERGDMRRFHARDEIEVETDLAFARKLDELVAAEGIPVVGVRVASEAELDHASFIPLHFLQRHLSLDAVRIVRIGLSGLPADAHRIVGRAIAQAARELDCKTVFIASGDLSHMLRPDGPYGFAPEGPLFDEALCTLFADNDLEGLFDLDEVLCDRAAECGLRSFWMMAAALEEMPHAGELLSYEGPFGVGYAVAAFEAEAEANAPATQEPENERPFAIADEQSNVDPLVALARLTIESYVRTGEAAPLPADIPAELLTERAGAFVSLHIGDDLRGCIGTIAPTRECLAHEIIGNAISAATRDPRFYPVRPDELDRLSYSVDVLGRPEPIASEAQLDVKRYGVIVTKGYRRGLLLPDLEGIDTVADQVAIAKRKADIGLDEDGVELERFEVIRHTRGGEARC